MQNHLPGPAATRKWFEAATRGDVGVLERQVSRMRDQHSRMLLHQTHPHFSGGAVANFPIHLTLDQAIGDLINMQQPWIQVDEATAAHDPYLDDYDGGSSAMILAAGKGHTEIVQYLLSLGCVNLGLTDAHGMTALHHTCVQGNADILKMLLLSCPTRSVQLTLLHARDARAMDCKKLVATGRSEWQSGGITAHASGSFLRRKAYQTLLLPGIRWWNNRKDRRAKRRRLGQGPSGDNAGARDFDRAQDLCSFPPGPANDQRLLSSVVTQRTLQTLLLASRRTRSSLATLSNEHIWLTALDYSEEEELELGSAVAHSPLLKTGMETVQTVSQAKQLLIVLRFLLNMKKGRAAIATTTTTAEETEMSLLLQSRGGAGYDSNGVRISWHNKDEKARQQEETTQMQSEDVKATRIRSYLTVDTLQLQQLLLLYNQLAGEHMQHISSLSSLKFSRFAALVGEFANEEHVATILTAMPSIMCNEEYVGDCSFVNFVGKCCLFGSFCFLVLAKWFSCVLIFVCVYCFFVTTNNLTKLKRVLVACGDIRTFKHSQWWSRWSRWGWGW